MNEIDEIIELFNQYKSIDNNNWNKQEIIELYHNWYDKSLILFRRMFDTEDLDLKKFMSVNNNGNGFILRNNFTEIRAAWHILVDRIKNRDKHNHITMNIIDTPTIFIVHGHDEALKQQVARFVERLGFNAIILHEQANKGNTIIEKIEECADTTSFAIILYTGCDKGTTKNSDELKPRARQNVVFEHGYFVGKLGRNHVCCLYEEGVELPSDLNGIIYIPADKNLSWQTTIAKEMKAVGLAIDMNKLIK